ncbi:hypothetical protein ABBQ32_005110 [Trebouxia sp. C0010 RCD-2024]
MSLERYSAGSPLSASFPAPSDSDQWLSHDFPDDLFGGTSELSQALSADDDKLFDLHGSASLPDALCELGSLHEHPNDRQVVMAAAAAAGLNRNGIRRTAFSTGDLQALSVLPSKSSPSPPDPVHVNLHRTISSSSVSAQPSLATVPEGSTINMGLSAGMPALQYSSEALVQTEDLSSMSVEELQAELIRTRQAFHSAGQANLPPMYGNSQPFMSHQGSYAPRPTYSHSQASFEDFSVPGMMGGTPAYNGGFYQDAAGQLQPLSSQAPAAAPAMDGMHSQSHHMVQSYADALLYHSDGPVLKQEPEMNSMDPAEPSSGICSSSQDGLPSRTAPAGPSTCTPTATTSQQQHDANRDRLIRRSQSAVELRTLGLPRQASDLSLKELQQVTVELTTPEGHVYKVGRLSNEERAQKILKYRQKRHERNFTKRIKYMCRKTLADTRPRVRGRFARNNDAGAVMPHETKKALAAKAKAGKAAAAAQGQHVPGMPMLANGRPPQPPSGLSQGSTGFGSNMIPVLQSRPGSAGGAPFQGAPAAGLTAASFMPVMPYQANPAHSDDPQNPPMQPHPSQGLQGPRFQAHFTQPFQFTPSVHQFQLQPSHQPQRMTPSAHLAQSLSSSQTLSSRKSSGLGNLPPGSSSLTQNV